MLSDDNANLLFDHILDGFEKSFEGIAELKSQPQVYNVTEKDITDLLEKNSKRLIARIKEFKLMLRMACVFFALQFAAIQVNGDELEMRRPARSSRARTSVRARARRGRRNDEGELMEETEMAA